MPSVNITVSNLALAQFAENNGVGKDKRIILVIDGAGWHTSPRVVIPEGIHFLFLPPYSPELQPAERLWPLTNEGMANRHFENLELLQETQSQRCLAISKLPQQIKALTCYKWWPILAC